MRSVQNRVLFDKPNPSSETQLMSIPFHGKVLNKQKLNENKFVYETRTDALCGNYQNSDKLVVRYFVALMFLSKCLCSYTVSLESIC